MENDIDDADDRSHTIGGFCDLEALSPSSYFKMRRLGLGPEETRVPGTKLVRITPRARREWHERMRALAHEADAQLESARRRQQAIEAGKRHAGRMRERRRLEALEAGKIAPGGRTRR